MDTDAEVKMTGHRPLGKGDSCKSLPIRKRTMSRILLIQRHQADVIGVLHGLDRLRFQGTLIARPHLN